MKDHTTIRDEISYLELEYTRKKEEHSKLDQIAMLSIEGAALRHRMSLITGMIHALKWVTDDYPVSQLHKEPGL